MPDHVVDPDALEALRAVAPDDGGKFLTELIDIFLADTPTRLRELSEATAAGNSVVACRAAHSMKGSAGNFGATSLAQLAFEIEQAAKAGNLDEVRAKTPALESAAALTMSALAPHRSP